MSRRRGLGWLAALGLGVPALAREPSPPEWRKGDTVRIAFIDPLTGPAADVGRNCLRAWQYTAAQIERDPALNPRRLRLLVAGFDNRGSPQESVSMLKAAIDQGFRYIVQGNGSAVAAALSDMVTRLNRRQPAKPVLYLNYAAMDPALTNEKCSYWHFRIDADTSMKARALVRHLASRPEVRTVFLVNQDYAHGQQVSLFVRQELARSLPGVRVVGNELHPPFRGIDFAAYAERIEQSGAQAVISGNWGADLRGLIKALQARGLRVPLYTYYASLIGTPTVLADTGERLPVFQVATHHDQQGEPLASLFAGFRQTHGEDMVIAAAYDGLVMLLQAMERSRSTDPGPVAQRLSGMLFQSFNGVALMRPEDHQLQKGVYVARWQRAVPGQGRSAEQTGYQFAPVEFHPAHTLRGESRCLMQRPDVG